MKGPPSAPNRPRLSISMTDLDVIEKVARLLGVRYVHNRLDLRNPKWKRAYTVSINGKRTAELMKLLSPHMGMRRRDQIQKALDSHDPDISRQKMTPETVLALREELSSYSGRLPAGKLVELSAKYGISRNGVRRIRIGKDWKHLV